MHFLQHIRCLTIFYLLETLSKPISLNRLPNIATNTLSTVCIGTHSFSFLYPYLRPSVSILGVYSCLMMPQGAVEEVLAVSTYVMEGNAVQPLDEVHIKNVQEAANVMTCKVRRYDRGLLQLAVMCDMQQYWKVIHFYIQIF